MIYCKELQQEFEDKKTMFKALCDSHEDIIAQKKAKIYNDSLDNHKTCIKARIIDASKIKTQIKGLEIDDDFYYIAVNTTKILDSHTDLHVNGIWNKTVKDQQGKNYLVADHELKTSTTIVRKEHIEMFVAEVPFSLLGYSYNGTTEALIYKFRKDKVTNPIYKEWLESGDEIQASVRMQYVKIKFALNSSDSEDKEFKKNYDQYINQVANSEDFKDGVDYFWVVMEAKNILESSLVLFGSNHVTGLIEDNNKNKKPSKDTSKQNNEPSKDTQKEFIKEIENFKFV